MVVEGLERGACLGGRAHRMHSVRHQAGAVGEPRGLKVGEGGDTHDADLQCTVRRLRHEGVARTETSRRGMRVEPKLVRLEAGLDRTEPGSVGLVGEAHLRE